MTDDRIKRPETTEGASPLILFAGDVHGQFEHLSAAVAAWHPQALVLLGDIEAPRPLADIAAPWEVQGTAVWFIPGNHDSDREDHWRHLESLAERNLHGRVVTVAGERLAGLGGIFRGQMWDPLCAPAYVSHAAFVAGERTSRRGRGAGARAGREEAPSPQDIARAGQILKHRSTIYPEDYERLWDETADILVTHEAPSCHPYGFTAIDELAQALGVKRLFHGHHHDCRDYRAWDRGLGFRAYGVGLRGLLDQEGVVRRVGDRDLERGR